MLRPPARGGPDTAGSEASRRDEACRAKGVRGGGTERIMGWEGAMLLAPHQGAVTRPPAVHGPGDDHRGQTPRTGQMRAQHDPGWWGALLMSDDPRTMLSQERCDVGRKPAAPNTTSPTTCCYTAAFHAPEP